MLDPILRNVRGDSEIWSNIMCCVVEGALLHSPKDKPRSRSVIFKIVFGFFPTIHGFGFNSLFDLTLLLVHSMYFILRLTVHSFKFAKLWRMRFSVRFYVFICCFQKSSRKARSTPFGVFS